MKEGAGSQAWTDLGVERKRKVRGEVGVGRKTSLGKKRVRSGRATKTGETERHRWVVGRDRGRDRIIGREEEGKRERKQEKGVGGGGNEMAGVWSQTDRGRGRKTHTRRPHE